LRQEVNGDGIRVLSIFPGRTDTAMQREILAMEQRTAPHGTLLRPEDVASMVIAALKLPATAEVTDIIMRPMQTL
jgi:NADP-dependent 3-hydroxy acid dehydrogenase YdfG